MGLYEEAVTLALQADIPLAKRVIQQAESVTGPISTRPTHHQATVATDRQDRHHRTQQLTSTPPCQLLKDCGSLQLEDMLPFFPDFVRIGELKDEINRSLTSYNAAIDALQADMNKSTQQAQDIRNTAAVNSSNATFTSTLIASVIDCTLPAPQSAIPAVPMHAHVCTSTAPSRSGAPTGTSIRSHASTP